MSTYMYSMQITQDLEHYTAQLDEASVLYLLTEMRHQTLLEQLRQNQGNINNQITDLRLSPTAVDDLIDLTRRSSGSTSSYTKIAKVLSKASIVFTSLLSLTSLTLWLKANYEHKPDQKKSKISIKQKQNSKKYFSGLNKIVIASLVFSLSGLTYLLYRNRIERKERIILMYIRDSSNPLDPDLVLDFQ